LKKIFEGFELKSREKNEKIKVRFEITPQYIIAYREIEEDKKLYFEERLLLSRKNNKLRVPLFYLPIKGFGIFERAKNNLNEKTNIYSFKDMGKQNSTHVKLGTKEEERIEIKVEGLTAVDKKSIIDLETDLDLTKRYIYVPSTLGAPRDIAQTSPFFQGQEKIVQLGLSENGIEVYNIDPKKEFFKPVFKKRPSLDETPVMTIPGRFVHISCKKSRQNYCLPTYGPGQDSSKEWKSKRFFIPNLKGLRIHEKNLLDLQHLKSDGCWSQGNNTQYISHTLKKGVINIELEKNIKINNLSSACLNSYWTTRMRHFSFNVRHFYSLVALDKFIPKNKALRYKPVLYPPFDRKFFGF
ncbi:MAG: hypothetical protein VXW15_09645, partial [Bdellovibrionota bacterium]|nr:hypothetical protein [Bdellovibrionota bacterium]